MKKNVLIILTWWTIAWNVAESDIIENIKSDWNAFLKSLEDSVSIIKKNRWMDIECSISELLDVDSSNINPENRVSIINEIHQQYDNYDAFIVLHGTNTMWYTTAACTFALENLNKPVIFTWSQVPLWYLWSDSETNLVNSLRMAVRWYHEIKWVIAVFWSQIISWARVKKWTDFDYDPFKSFQSWSLWQIGRFIKIDEPQLTKHISYLSRKKPLAIQAKILNLQNKFDAKNIASLSEFPWMKVELFQSLVENNWIKWFIFRSYWAWDPNEKLFPAFEYLKEKQIPIVVTTQAPWGVSNFEVNETWQFLKENDLAIPAYDMSIEAMTVKLSWLLWLWYSYEKIKIKMLEDLHWEITIGSELI